MNSFSKVSSAVNHLLHFSFQMTNSRFNEKLNATLAPLVFS